MALATSLTSLTTTSVLTGATVETERNSSGMCAAPTSAVLAIACEIVPSDANESMTARTGVCGGAFNIGLRMSGVGGVGSAFLGGGAAAGAGAAGADDTCQLDFVFIRAVHTWNGCPSAEEVLIFLPELYQGRSRERRPHGWVVFLVREQRLATRAGSCTVFPDQIAQLQVRKVLVVR